MVTTYVVTESSSLLKSNINLYDYFLIMSFICEVSIYQVNCVLHCFRIGVATAAVGLSACIGQLKYWTLKCSVYILQMPLISLRENLILDCTLSDIAML